MLPIEGQPILTAAQMRAAEERAAPTPEAMYALMERAGAGVAHAVRRLAAGAEVLILCGPGNNGGDGYVAARVLREWGHAVRVAAFGEATTDLARRARVSWSGNVEALADATSAPILVDALFGTGLTRPMSDVVMTPLREHLLDARLRIAVDLPTGVQADTGARLHQGLVPGFDLTLALGALKPAHVQMPTSEACGVVRLLDFNLHTEPKTILDRVSSDLCLAPVRLHPPVPWAHKFSRGMVIVIGGSMPGASGLAVVAAMRSGAGYGLLFNDEPDRSLPRAVVQRRWSPDAFTAALKGKQNAVVVIGPGLGRDEDAKHKVDVALTCAHPVVIDADALHLLDEGHFAAFALRGQGNSDERVVLTPHAGEFEALFGKFPGSKIEAARDAAHRSGAIVAFKGPDTVVAHPTGEISAMTGATPWLSTAGTGDVLAGTIAGAWQAVTMYDQVEAGVWLHAEAARRCGPSFIADDLVAALTPARASLCR